MPKVLDQKYRAVTDLILEGNRIGPAGVEHLVKANWNELKSINLGICFPIQQTTILKTKASKNLL